MMVKVFMDHGRYLISKEDFKRASKEQCTYWAPLEQAKGQLIEIHRPQNRIGYRCKAI